MSSFLPEGGRYELLTIIGKVQGLPLSGSRVSSARPPSPEWMCARSCELVSRIQGDRFGGLLCVCLPSMGKELLLPGEKLFCSFSFLACTLLLSCAVVSSNGWWRREWKKTNQEMSALRVTVVTILTWISFWDQVSWRQPLLLLSLFMAIPPFLLGKGFEDLMTVNLARYKPTGEYVTVRRINLEACSNEMVTFLQVIKCEWDAGRVGS